MIIALGVDKASLHYKHMDPEELEQVTLEVAKLGFWDARLTEKNLNEYYLKHAYIVLLKIFDK